MNFIRFMNSNCQCVLSAAQRALVPRSDPAALYCPCTPGVYSSMCEHACRYKRVKGRSHTVEKRISMPPHKPHATSQPSRFAHTPRLSTDSAQNQHACKCWQHTSHAQAGL